jgi:hypothetical protein
MCALINNVQQQFDSFFHQYVNMVWTTKGTKGTLLSVLHSFINTKCQWPYKEHKLLTSQTGLLL